LHRAGRASVAFGTLSVRVECTRKRFVLVIGTVRARFADAILAVAARDLKLALGTVRARFADAILAVAARDLKLAIGTVRARVADAILP
jgi:hypothetical protein